MGARKYRAFISYSHSDKRWGDWLHQKLETYRVPKKLIGRETTAGVVPARLTPIFRDREELSAADSLSDEIEAALAASQFLIVLCSPRSAQSQWVNREILRFKELHGEGRVLAAILDGEPGTDNECFPEALKFRIGENGQLTDEPTEPIAADFRKGKDGKRAGLHKLIAGLIGVKLDDLIEREAQRRMARLRVAAGGFGLVAAGMGALAVNAVIARDEAREQRAEAVAARGQAEDVIEYMLTDLRDELSAVGRLDIMDSVGERALAYYDARDLASADPDALGRRARAQLLVGEVDNTLGNLDAALAAYEAAAATTAEQLRRDPDNEQRLFDHAQSVFFVGYIAWQRGQTDKAKEQFTEYYNLAQRLVELDPDNPDWQAELDYAHSNLGTLALDQGDAAGAIPFFEKSLEFAKRVASERSASAQDQLALAESYSWLASAQEWTGAFDEASRNIAAERAILDALLDVDPDNTNVERRLAINARMNARLTMARGEVAGAVDILESAEVRLAALRDKDPVNTEWMQRYGQVKVQLAIAYFHNENKEQARKTSEQARVLAVELLAYDEGIVEWKIANHAAALRVQARIENDAGEFDSSMKFSQAAIEICKAIIIDAGPSPKASDCLAIAYLEIARSYGLSGQDAQAQDFAQSAVQEFERFPEKAPFEAKADLVEAYQLADQQKMARELALELDSLNYRHPRFLEILSAYSITTVSGDE